MRQEKLGEIGNEEQDKSKKTELNEPVMDKNKALKQVTRLKDFFIQKSDAKGLKLLYDLQVHEEKWFTNESKKQNKITNFYCTN